MNKKDKNKLDALNYQILSYKLEDKKNCLECAELNHLCEECCSETFTEKLVNLQKIVMGRQVGKTKLYISPETEKDIENWGIKQY